MDSNGRPVSTVVNLQTGVRLRYVQQGNPWGSPVILLHGYPDSWFSYSQVLPLVPIKYCVYVLDQRGHGDSDRPSRAYLFSDFAADVLAFMDAKGLSAATIVGHSMGSFVAQHVASIAPERVSRLLLIGSASTVRNEVLLGLQREVCHLSDPIPEQFAREFQMSTVFKPLPNDFLDQLVNESLKLPARVWKEVLAGMLTSQAANLKNIKMPTLVLWGDKEAIFVRSEQDALMSDLPDAILKVYKDSGHSLHWEQPREFAKDLEDFMESG